MKELSIKGGAKILAIIRNFSAIEKTIFGIFTIIAIITALIMAWEVNKLFLVPIPSQGGSLTEGVVGLPRSVNPVLAFTDADRDLSALIYSGLMKYDHGKLVGDLARSYTMSEDGLTYTFNLKDALRFHDGIPLTTDDIEFTVQKVQDSALKSPRRADWADITIKKVSATQIQFILRQPYAPFLANTTLGILPKHIWKNVNADQFIFSQYNIDPIGSGPYRVDGTERDSGGIPSSYSLIPFSRYYDQQAHISHISIRFYPNEKAELDAYNAGIIESVAGISPQEASIIASSSSHGKVLHTPLPRVFGVFFNQNNSPVLANKEVRQALDMAVDKNKIVKDILYGYGVSLDGPIPPSDETSPVSPPASPDAAKALLAKNGWTINSDGVLEKKDKKATQVLQFSIATADAPDLKQAADILKKTWEKIGARVTVKVFESGDLSQNIIKTRKYDALLFAEFVGKDLDLYAFWHSSQRTPPGLNIAMYVNSKVDALLESARSTSDEAVRAQKYDAFQKILADEVPAIFLYSPEYLYVVPDKIQGLDFGPIANPSDRWYGVQKWFISTDYVWNIFTKK